MYDEALEALGRGALRDAEEKADQLEALGWSRAYEIRAMALHRAGRLADAIAALDHGIGAAPGDGSLHLLRANLLDASGRSDEALEAYEEALRVGSVASIDVHYNRAVARLRRGDAGGALADAERVVTEAPEATVAPLALRVAVDALITLNRHEDAVAIVEHLLASVDARSAEASLLHGVLAKALLAAERPLEEVLRVAARAIDAGAASDELLDVLARLATPDERPRSRYRVVLDVPLDASAPRDPRIGAEAAGYLRVALVAALDEEEARALAIRLEPSGLRDRVRVESLTREGASELRRSCVVPPLQRAFYGA